MKEFTLRFITTLLITLIFLIISVFPNVNLQLDTSANLSRIDSNDIELDVLASGKISFKSRLEGSISSKCILDVGTDLLIDFTFISDMGYNFNKFFKVYLISSYDFLEKREILGRISLGAGSKLSYINTSNVITSVSLIPFYHYERYAENDFLSSFRLSFRHKVKIISYFRNANITWTIFYKPIPYDFSSFIIDSDVSLIFKIPDFIGFKVSYLYYYDINTGIDFKKSVHKVFIGLFFRNY